MTWTGEYFEICIELEKVRERSLTIGTHRLPHANEIGACFLLQNYATNKRLVEECVEGQLMLGIGGGKFDHHSLNNETTCYDLIAEAFGCKYKKLEHIRVFIADNNNNGAKGMINIASLYKAMNTMWSNDESVSENIAWFLRALNLKSTDTGKHANDFSQERIIELSKSCSDFDYFMSNEKWIERAVNTEKAWQGEFFDQACRELENLDSQGLVREAHGLFFIKNGKGKSKAIKPKICGVMSSHVRMATALRVKKQADVFLVYNPTTKYYLIGVNKNTFRHYRDALLEVFKILQVNEKRVGSDPDRWYYFKPAINIYNGSLTHPHIKPSALKFGEVFAAVCVGMKQDALPKSCDGKNCYSCFLSSACLYRCKRRVDIQKTREKSERKNIPQIVLAV
ncbi:hypothetical protein C0583_01220 [Candidatus Parcubacteria bacterium]|nr:MAG: hypothetical protein C0583_01220 [Candidatus Parcubacteria bacterium]